MDFAPFRQALQQNWGDDAARTRHEIYFIAQRKQGWRQILHATAGLLRDVFLCARLPRRAADLGQTVCAVSLTGASGIGTLTPYIAQLQAEGQTPVVVMHPRLKGKVAGVLPAAPDKTAWAMAFKTLFRRSKASIPGVSSWTVRCCLARRALWLGAWRRTLTQSGNVIQTVLLHNDFDLFSSTAVEALKQLPAARSVCVQHGLPTDEFFPTQADSQLVWGETSRQVYLAHGAPEQTLILGTHRCAAQPAQSGHSAGPRRILLVSQTHTPIFGRSLRNDFMQLATALSNSFDADMFRILLHPEESRLGHPYSTNNLLSRCENAPHPILNTPREEQSDPAIVLGFCSTALLDAAQAGHYVIGLDWPASASLGALTVGAPPTKVKTAEELPALFATLQRDAPFRAAWMQQQGNWLSATLSPVSRKSNTFAPLTSHTPQHPFPR